MAKLFDLVKVNIPTAGTGDVTFGTPVSPGFFQPSEVGASDGDVVRYVIVDGDNVELGVGLIKSTVTQMERTVTKSKIGGVVGTSPINLSGTAVLALTASAADIGDMKGPSGATSGNIVTFDGATGKLVKDSGTSVSSVVLSSLLNAARAANSTGSGVSADGSMFVDLLNSTLTLDTASSSNYKFVKGGVQPTSAPGAYADAAYGLQAGGSTGWTGYTIVHTITAATIAAGGFDKDFLRFTFRAGTGGACTIGYAFVGIYGSTDSFDPAYPITPVYFSGGKTVTMSAAATAVSDAVRYTIPFGKALMVAYYVVSGGFVSIATRTGWVCSAKAATNEPAKIFKSGYTAPGSGNLMLERIEYASDVYNNMTVVSRQLPIAGSPTKADLVAFLEGDTAGASDLALSVSRDGATWKAVAWSDYYSINGKRGIAAVDTDLTSGAGTGSALYWKAVSANNKRIKICDIALRQSGGVFTDVPSVPLVPSAPTITRQRSALPLGYDESAGIVKYGWLWDFFQDWEITGPTRFHVKLRCNLVHNHPVADTAVAWTIPVTARYAVDAAAMGAKPTSVTDTDGYLNNAMNWLDFDSGNITSRSEHYKTAYLDFTVDFFTPGVYRFGVGGHSATAVDSPLTSGRITLNWEESSGASAREFLYNRFEIVATPLR